MQSLSTGNIATSSVAMSGIAADRSHRHHPHIGSPSPLTSLIRQLSGDDACFQGKFIQQLQDSDILSQETLQGFLPPHAEPKDVEALAKSLVRKKALTEFQARELYRGNGRANWNHIPDVKSPP